MQFLVDESTGLKVARSISDDHDVVSVADIQPSIPDSEVLALASQQDRILITNDKDFGELVFKRKEPHSGVILLRLSNDTPTVRIRVLQYLIITFGDKLKNKFTIATEHKVRMRTVR